jgi:hypothetical protein
MHRHPLSLFQRHDRLPAHPESDGSLNAEVGEIQFPLLGLSENLLGLSEHLPGIKPELDVAQLYSFKASVVIYRHQSS